jgi:hypothetical protein
MSDQTFVLEYVIGDGFTYSATVHEPIVAPSKEAVLDAFDLAMAAYEPKDGPTHFVMFGKAFEYDCFIHRTEKQITKRRRTESYDCEPPRIYSIDEWVVSQQRETEFILANKYNKVFTVPPAKDGNEVSPCL